MSDVIGREARARLAHQALGRPLTEAEQTLASALEDIFKSGQHELSEVVILLQMRQIQRPSLAAGAWTLEVLEQELSRINASLDVAYSQNGVSEKQD